MKIILNGEPFEHEGNLTVAALLEALGIRGARVAIMVNDGIVKKDRFDESDLAESDRVEVIHMVGGG